MTTTTTELAKLLNVTERRVRQMVSEGLIPAPTDRLFDLGQTIRALIAAERAKVTSKALNAARTRKTLADAALSERELELLEGRLIERQRVVTFLERVFSAMRTKIIGSGLSAVEQDEILADLRGLKDTPWSKSIDEPLTSKESQK